MPFSSLTDPGELALAHASFQEAWRQVVAEGIVSDDEAAERSRLAQIVTALLPVCRNEDELVLLAISQFARGPRDDAP